MESVVQVIISCIAYFSHDSSNVHAYAIDCSTDINSILCIDICRGGYTSHYISNVVTVMREVDKATEITHIRLTLEL